MIAPTMSLGTKILRVGMNVCVCAEVGGEKGREGGREKEREREREGESMHIITHLAMLSVVAPTLVTTN